MTASLRVCSRCVMDTTASEITFDDSGVCSFCQRFDKEIAPALARVDTPEGARRFREIIASIQASGRGRKYDSLLGLSGGTDSSFLAHLAARERLRPLVVHVDMGWNTPESEENVRLMTEKLRLDLKTVEVDFEVMRALQLSFYRAGVRNCEIPQDHAFLAVLYGVAAKHGIRTLLTGGNLATESIMPRSWGYNAGDARHLRAIHRRFGSGSLRKYPTLGFLRRYVYYPFVRGIREVRLLNYILYNRAQAKALLSSMYGWADYGSKHFESALTRFFQGYYLPTKFGVDKRKAHFSSLILSGQMTREQAVEKLAQPPYDPKQLEVDMRAIASALKISLEEWRAILASPIRQHDDFPSQKWMFALKDAVVTKLGLRERWWR